MLRNKNALIRFFIFFIIASFLLPNGRQIGSFLLPVVTIMLAWYIIGNKKMFRNFSADNLNQTFDPSNMQNQMKQVFTSLTKTSGVIALSIILLVLFIKSIVIIPAGMVGVYHLFGQVSDQEISSGLHFVNPFASVTKMSIRTEEYTMSVVQGEGERVQADAITALTKEGLSVDLDITVFYHLIEDKASDVFSNLGTNYEEKILRPEIRSSIREVIARYDAKAIYSEKREEAATGILNSLAENLNSRGIEVEQALLRNVQLPQKLIESIQEKLTAEQDAERMNFVLDKERKEAERKRIEAEGQRDSQTIINQSLTDRYLEYLYVNSLKEREGTIYVPTEGGLPLYKNVP